MKTTIKTARTLRPYFVRAFGWDITVPTGSLVSNRTACGPDDNYRFWQDFGAVVQELTGYRCSILAHDLRHYGLNIPAEYCEHYPEPHRFIAPVLRPAPGAQP